MINLWLSTDFVWTDGRTNPNVFRPATAQAPYKLHSTNSQSPTHSLHRFRPATAQAPYKQHSRPATDCAAVQATVGYSRQGDAMWSDCAAVQATVGYARQADAVWSLLACEIVV